MAVIPIEERKFPKTLVLFDVDGTLTPARLVSLDYCSRAFLDSIWIAGLYQISYFPITFSMVITII